MTQEIRRDVKVSINVEDNGGIAKLESIKAILKQMETSAKAVSNVFGNFGGKVSSVSSKASSSLKKVSSDANKATASLKNMTLVMKNLDGTTTVTKGLNLDKISKNSSMVYGTDISSYGMKSSSTGIGGESSTKNLRQSSSILSGKILPTLKSINKESSDASWNFFRTRAILATIAMTVGTIGAAIAGWYQLASDYAEANHLYYSTLASSVRDVNDELKTYELHAENVFGQKQPDQFIMVTENIYRADQAVRQLADDLMLDPTNVKRTYATFYELGNSAGIASEKLTTMSQGMTQLTYDLASLWDMPFQDVADKLQSGLSGVTSAVRSMGIDISRTAADAWLLENGFSATYNQLTRNNKMLVIYNMLMENTATAQGDLARSALQPANMLRILQEQTTIAARQLGAAFFPVLTKIIPVLIMIARAAQAAAAAISNFMASIFGSWYTDAFNQWNSYLSGLGAASSVDIGLGDMESDLGSVGDAASDTQSALEDLNNFQLGFDELHVLSPDTSGADDGSGSGAGAGAGELDIDIPVIDPYDYLGGESTVLDTITAEFENSMAQIKAAVDGAFGTGTFEAFMSAMGQIADSFWDLVGTIVTSVGRVAGALAGLLDWPEFLRGLADGFSAVVDTISNVIDGLSWVVSTVLGWEPIRSFFQNWSYEIGWVVGALGGVATAIGVLKGAFGLLNLVLTPFKALFSPLGTIAKTVGEFLFGAGDKTKKAGNMVDEAGKAVSKSGLGKLLSGIAEKVTNSKLITIIGNIITKFGSLLPKAIGFLGPKLLGLATGPIGWVITGVTTVLGVLDMFGISLEDIGAAAWGFVQDAGAALADFFTKTVPEAVSGFGQMLIDTVTTAFNDFVSFLANPLEFVGKAIEAIGSFFGAIFGGSNENPMADTERNVAESSDAIDSKSKSAASNVDANWSTAFNSLPGSAQSAMNQCLEKFDWFSGVGWERMYNAGKNVGNGLAQGIKEMHYTIENEFRQIPMDYGVRDAMNRALTQVRNGVNDILNEVSRLKSMQIGFNAKTSGFRTYWTGSNTYRFGSRTMTYDSFNIQWFAKGGIIDGPMVAGVGEAGPEAIVPLSSDRMKPFASAIADNLNRPSTVGSANASAIDSRFLNQLVSSVTKAVRDGMPEEIASTVYLDATKVNKELDKNRRYRGLDASRSSTVVA